MARFACIVAAALARLATKVYAGTCSSSITNQHMAINWLADSKFYITSTIRVPANATGTICARNQKVTMTGYIPPEVGHYPDIIRPHVHDIPMPDACTTVSENVIRATTIWNETTGWTTQVASTCSDVDIYMSSAAYHVEKESFLGWDNVVLFLVKIEWTADFETTDGFENANVSWRFSNAGYWSWAEGLEDYSTISIRPADAQNPIKPECSGERTTPFYKAGTPFPYQLISYNFFSPTGIRKKNLTTLEC